MDMPGQTPPRADANNAPRSVRLHHPTQPYTGKASAARLAADLRELANAYLATVQTSAGISREVMDVLRSDSHQPPNFGWWPLSWGAGALEQSKPQPMGSFWVARQLKGKLVGCTVVLLAGYRLKDNQPAGGEVGLRVLLHLAPWDSSPDWTVRITGMSSSMLPQSFGSAPTLEPKKLQVPQRIGKLIEPLGYWPFGIDGLAYIDPTMDHSQRVFVSAVKPSLGGGASRNYRFVVDLPADGSAPQWQSPVERISHVSAEAFVQDPASIPPSARPESRRATRLARVLDPLRIYTERVPPVLQRHVNTLELQVRQTRLGQVSGYPDSDPDDVQEVDPNDLPLRSDDLAAAHAYLRGDELMRRLEAYGLMPALYFKHASLPLLLRHRAPLKGARDGISVNAQVRPIGVGPGIEQPGSGDLQPPLEVSFGWAEFAHRVRLENGARRLREQPLGLAADARWAWHEFAHVLNYASFGELEFRFAHSAGDALAAIVADPDACRQAEPGERFRTFPWIFIPRRHDRDAMRGWCWCGRRNLARRSQQGLNTSRLPHLGYFEEQLLSSSLFRLYRSIGGDDSPPETRHSASDYCVYLVMHAIQQLGAQPAVPAYQIEAFVDALIDADIGAGPWDISASWPEAYADDPRDVHRVGCCVHKVIRWAFERQGLYANVADTEVYEGPGKPPPVDIYIADRRPGEVGAYEPVPLLPAGGGSPLWHASDSGIEMQMQKVVVHVGNRGSLPASAVTVRCWVLASAQGQDVPSNWTELAGETPAQAVDPGTVRDFSFKQERLDGSALGLIGNYLVKASATCADDRSNLDPLTGFPLWDLSVPIADLVANDNNLALRALPFP